MSVINLLLDAVSGGKSVLARLEGKLDAQNERLSAIQVDVAALKAKDGEAGARHSHFWKEEWPAVRQMVQETARQLAVTVEVVGGLARNVQELQTRMDRGEGQIAELRGLQESVRQLRDTDGKVATEVSKFSTELDALKTTVTRWGGGLAVVIAVATVVWAMLPFRVVTSDGPAPAQIQPPVYVMPPPAAPTAEPPRGRGR
jgi:hypothetical protein